MKCKDRANVTLQSMHVGIDTLGEFEGLLTHENAPHPWGAPFENKIMHFINWAMESMIHSDTVDAVFASHP